MAEEVYYCVDIQSVATGLRCGDRAIACVNVSATDGSLDQRFVFKPDAAKIVSPLTPLTGITTEDLEGAPSFAEVAVDLQALLNDKVLVVQGSELSLRPLLAELRVRPSSVRSMSERFKARNPPGHKFPFQYFTLDVEYQAVTGVSLQASGLTKAQALRELWNAKELPAEGRLRSLYHSEPPSFAVQHPRFEGVCMGHIASGPRGWSCPCGERTRAARKW